MDRIAAMQLLLACRGDEIWPLEHCRELGVPEAWIAELADCHESGFRFRAQEIWTDAGLVNQFHGVADVRIAVRAAAELGIPVERFTARPVSPAALVHQLQAELDELT